MNIKLRAALYTVGIAAGFSVFVAAMVFLLEQIPVEMVPAVFTVFLIGIGLNFIYSVVKAHLEFKAKMTEITAKK